MIYHKPVLLNESIEGLNINPKGVYADLTFGGGGHSRLILEKMGKRARLLAFDQDSDAQKNAPDDKRLIFIHSNFRFLQNFVRFYDCGLLNGVIADLGISSHQIDIPERGFTHRENARLDMRMNTENELTAEIIINDYEKEKLFNVLRNYGELPNANQITGRILKARETKRIISSDQLISILEPLLPRNTRIKFLSMLFQALRIEVNDELGALKELLNQITDLMATGGRLVILSYHSVEDRVVKNFIKSGNIDGEIKKDFFGNVNLPFRAINKNVITPDREEISQNPRARSAKLRIAERTEI